ncbi:MAG: hypothetical protein PPP55_12170 [Halorubrum sp.]
MATESADAGLRRVDNRSKAAAVVGTLVAFGIGVRAIGEVQFVSIAAIAVGIGIRFGSLWIGTRYLTAAGSSTLTEQPTAGGYHHGAVGIALVSAGVIALTGRILGGDVPLVAGVSVGVAVVGVLGLSALLPD